MGTLTLFMGLCCLTAILLVLYSTVQEKLKGKKKKTTFGL